MNRNELEDLLGVQLTERPLFDLETGLRWRPTLGNIEEGVAVHVTETEAVGPSISRRLKSARSQGLTVCVALPLGPVGLDSESQEALLLADVEVVSPPGPDEAPVKYGDLAEAIWRQRVLLDADVADRVAARFLRDAALNTDATGKLLERALAFTSSQVAGWEVDDVNYRTENEELDVLVANNSAKSPWNGTAWILLESKNWSKNVDRAEYDSFHMKIKERGGFCRLGIFVAAHGFSAGFYERAEHHGTEGFSIVPLTVEWLATRLAGQATIEEALAERVREVVLDRRWEEVRSW